MARTRDSILVAALVLSGAVTIAVASGCSGSSAKDGATSANDVVASPDLVIRQVYGGGGNANAPLRNDFIELFNRGQAAVNLEGKSLQYAQAAGNFSGDSALALPAATLQPGQSYLVKLKSGGANGAELPAADFSPEVPLSLGAQDGKVAIAPTAAPLNGCGAAATPCAPDLFIDLVGYGSSSQAEGGAAVPALSNVMAAVRKNNGCSDFGNNASDFEVAAPSPRTAASPMAVCDADAGPAPAHDAGDAGPAPVEAGPATDAAAADAGPPKDAGPVATSAVLLNELKINPGGNADTPWEYAEILCPAGSSLKGYYFVALEGDGDSSGGSPGVADIVVDLSDKSCGSNGLVMIKAAAGGHTAAAGTTVVTTTALDTGSGFENATTSFVLVKSPDAPMVQGTDYDTANGGTLALPAGASIVDGVSVFEQSEGIVDHTYAPRLTKAGITADAAARLVGTTTALSADAWYFGDLKGTKPDGLEFDPTRSSANLPAGASLTPGAANATASSTKPGGGDQPGGGGDPGGSEDPGGEPTGGSSTGGGTSGSPGRLAQPPGTPKSSDSGSCAATPSSSTTSNVGLFGIGLALAGLAARRKRR